MIQLPQGFDSIFRYIVVVSQRAEQLVNGAKPRAASRHDKPTLVALDDVEAGAVDWRILTQEELDAQRQAIVDQLRAEVGVTDGDGPAVAAIPDVLPTAARKPIAMAADDDRDDELARLQKLLGMAGGARGGAAIDDEEEDEDEAFEDDFDEDVETIDLEEASEELDGAADDEDDG
ncbi:MAG: DNA-directed RNA polymerase subunit omega [Thermoanaerobaculales bacterium]|jgi:DNA-directed RNA polymerase subunit K/omega|nr:DNA-directed RNA polymerase subunit omega [Thermoanaerobaculales bacterium]